MDNTELKKEEKNQKIHLNGCALFLSEFSFMIITAIIVPMGVIFPSYHKTTEYTSFEGPSWNSNSDPLIFTHISDIHITSLKEIDKYRTLFRTAKKLGANFHLLTGDLADHYKTRRHPKVGKQNQKDWKYYKELLDTELYNETILDVAGNHDVFGVISPFDDDFGFLDASKAFTRKNTKLLKDFWFKTVNIEGMNFILLNPYHFPMVHPPYGYYPHAPKKLLNLLEQEINSVGPCNILTHYTVDFFMWEKNRKGNTFGKIMKNQNIQYIFSGHTHPREFRIRHHEYGGLEFIGTSSKKTNDFGLVTIDNGRLVYNRVGFNENNFDKYFMTHPVPIDQITKTDNFNEKNTEIRIISYKNEIEDNLYITGDFRGKLKYQRVLKNGAKLYSMALNIIKEGEYEITFKAPGFEINRKFYFGKKIKIKGERKDLINSFVTPFIISVIVILLFLLIITFPIRILDFSYIDDWILGNNQGKRIYWIICICLSPLILNYRICTNAPLYFRIILFFFLCYPLLLPIHFFEPIKGHTGYAVFSFFVIYKKILYDEWSIFFNSFYFWLIISPIAIIVSGLKYRQSCFYKAHFILLFLFFVLISFFNFRFAGESVKFWLLLFHPCFVIIPLILKTFMYIVIKKYNKIWKDESEKIVDKNMNTINDNTIITVRNSKDSELKNQMY